MRRDIEALGHMALAAEGVSEEKLGAGIRSKEISGMVGDGRWHLCDLWISMVGVFKFVSL